MTVFVLIIFDSILDERKAAAFASSTGAEGTLLAWARQHNVVFEVDKDAGDGSNVWRHYTSTDGLIKAVMLEMPVVGV